MATMKKLPPTHRTSDAITTMACLTLMFRLRVIIGKNFQMQKMSTPKRLYTVKEEAKEVRINGQVQG
jgi:hypothetical protein